MKKFLLFLTCVLTLFGTARAEDLTAEFDLSSSSYSSSVGQITLALGKGSGSSNPAYNTSDKGWRLYGKNDIKITSKTGYKITKIEFSCKSFTGWASPTASVGTLASSSPYTWSAGNNSVSEVTIVPRNDTSSGNIAFTKITVTYESTSGGGTVTPEPDPVDPSPSTSYTDNIVASNFTGISYTASKEWTSTDSKATYKAQATSSNGFQMRSSRTCFIYVVTPPAGMKVKDIELSFFTAGGGVSIYAGDKQLTSASGTPLKTGVNTNTTVEINAPYFIIVPTNDTYTTVSSVKVNWVPLVVDPVEYTALNDLGTIPLEKGDTKQLELGTNPPSINFELSNSNISISKTGLIEAKEAGETKVTANWAEVANTWKASPENGVQFKVLVVAPRVAVPRFAYSATTADWDLAQGVQNANLPTLNIDPAGLEVTYTSSDVDVATVDATNGKVTPLAKGTTTITASFNGNENYKEATASYTLTVINSDIKVSTAVFYSTASKPNEGIYETSLVGAGNISGTSTTAKKFEAGNITMWIEKKNTSSTSNVNGNEVRWYANDLLHITPSEGAVIKKVVINCVSSYSKIKDIADDYGKGSTSGLTYTWEGNIDKDLVISNTEQARFNKITVTYEGGVAPKLEDYKAFDKYVEDGVEFMLGNEKSLELGETHPTIEYTYSQEGIITIDESGKITAAQIGEVEVTASWKADNMWNEGSAKFNVNVKKPEPVAPSNITIKPDDNSVITSETEISIESDGTEPTITYRVNDEEYDKTYESPFTLADYIKENGPGEYKLNVEASNEKGNITSSVTYYVESGLDISHDDEKVVKEGTTVIVSDPLASAIYITTYEIDGTSKVKEVKATEASYIVEKMHRRFEVQSRYGSDNYSDTEELFYNLGVEGDGQEYVRVNSKDDLQIGDKLVLGYFRTTGTGTTTKTYRRIMSNERPLSSGSSTGYDDINWDTREDLDINDANLALSNLPENTMILELENGSVDGTVRLKHGEQYLSSSTNSNSISLVEKEKSTDYTIIEEGGHIMFTSPNTAANADKDYALQFNTNNQEFFSSYKINLDATAQLPADIFRLNAIEPEETHYEFRLHFNSSNPEVATLALTDEIGEGDVMNYDAETGNYTISVKSLTGEFSLSIDGEHQLVGHADQALTDEDFHNGVECPESHDPYVYVGSSDFSAENPIRLILANTNNENAVALNTHPNAYHDQTETLTNRLLTVNLKPFEGITMVTEPEVLYYLYGDMTVNSEGEPIKENPSFKFSYVENEDNPEESYYILEVASIMQGQKFCVMDNQGNIYSNGETDLQAGEDEDPQSPNTFYSYTLKLGNMDMMEFGTSYINLTFYFWPESGTLEIDGKLDDGTTWYFTYGNDKTMQSGVLENGTHIISTKNLVNGNYIGVLYVYPPKAAEKVYCEVVPDPATDEPTGTDADDNYTELTNKLADGAFPLVLNEGTGKINFYYLNAQGEKGGEYSTSYKVINQTPTGVEGVDVEEAEAVYYNLQGVQVKNPEKGIYIKVTGNKTEKVVL